MHFHFCPPKSHHLGFSKDFPWFKGKLLVVCIFTDFGTASPNARSYTFKTSKSKAVMQVCTSVLISMIIIMIIITMISKDSM